MTTKEMYIVGYVKNHTIEVLAGSHEEAKSKTKSKLSSDTTITSTELKRKTDKVNNS